MVKPGEPFDDNFYERDCYSQHPDFFVAPPPVAAADEAGDALAAAAAVGADDEEQGDGSDSSSSGSESSTDVEESDSDATPVVAHASPLPEDEINDEDPPVVDNDEKSLLALLEEELDLEGIDLGDVD